MMRYVLATALTVAVTPLMAQSEDGGDFAHGIDAARAAVEATALELDVNNDQLISRSELMAAAFEGFSAYDVDESGDIDITEWTTAPFGFSEMARARGREQAYNAAMGLVFDLFDRDDDQLLSNGNFLAAMNGAFSYADMNKDDELTGEEFRRGFIMNVALRQAMRE